VPNQNTLIKFLIREGVSLQFPETTIATRGVVISQNGTEKCGALGARPVVSMG
jgi:hypothetical protein